VWRFPTPMSQIVTLESFCARARSGQRCLRERCELKRMPVNDGAGMARVVMPNAVLKRSSDAFSWSFSKRSPDVAFTEQLNGEPDASLSIAIKHRSVNKPSWGIVVGWQGKLVRGEG
jgi:hypothetical protein